MKQKGIIYIVDDDSSALRGLTRLLCVAGYQVNGYASSDELLNSSITAKNACLLLDARMPGLSGMGLRVKLEERGLKIPVIFITADDDHKTRFKARELNAVGFFRKPVDGPALLDAISWALETTESDRRQG